MPPQYATHLEWPPAKNEKKIRAVPFLFALPVRRAILLPVVCKVCPHRAPPMASAVGGFFVCIGVSPARESNCGYG